MIMNYILIFVLSIGYAESAKIDHLSINKKIITLEKNVTSLQSSGRNLLRSINGILSQVRRLKPDRHCFPCKTIKDGKICDCKDFPPKRDCLAFHKDGFRLNGLYQLNGFGRFNHRTAFCDQTTMGGGWTVIQRRKDGSVDFNRKWDVYKKGFGALTDEFWFGNENIHDLTKLANAPKKSQLLINMRMKGQSTTVYARYNTLELGDEQSKYVLKINGFVGNATGDGMAYHNNTKFTTIDNDNSDKRTCAKLNGGWWMKWCYVSFLNGPYKFSGSKYPRIYWIHSNKDAIYRQPEFVEMKVRRNH